MHKTLSFVRLDFYTIKPYRKSMLMLAVLASIMGVAFRSPSMLSTMFMVYLMLVMSYPFTIAEKNQMDILYTTLGIGRNTVVSGRYLFVLVLWFIAVAIVALLSGLLALLTETGAATENLLSIGILSGVFFLVVAVQYPLYFKFGYSKAKWIAFAPMLCLFAAVMLLPKITGALSEDSLPTWDSLLSENIYAFSLLPLLIGTLLLFASCLVSRRLYRTRDI